MTVTDNDVQAMLRQTTSNPALHSNSDFWAHCAKAVLDAGHPELALACFTRANDLSPKQGHVLDMAAVLGLLDRHDEAIQLAETAPAGCFRKAAILANNLQGAGRHVEAIAQYQLAIAEEPGFYLPYVRILTSLERLGYPSYDYWLQLAFTRFPRDPWVQINYCRHLFKERRFSELAQANWIDDAESERRDDVIGTDDNGLAAALRAFRSAARSFCELTEDALSASVRDLLDCPATHQQQICAPAKLVAFLAAEFGRPRYVTEAYARVCSLCRHNNTTPPDSVDELLGRAWQRAGDHRQAIEMSKQALRLDPNSRQARKTLWWSLDEVGDTAEAVDIAESLYGVDGNDDYLAYSLGFMCGKIGQYGKAKYYHQQQLTSTPRHLWSTENLAFIFLLEASFDESMTWWQQYLAILDSWSLSQEVPTDFCVDKFFQPDGSRADMTMEVARLRQLKNAAFVKLMRQARDSEGSTSYLVDLVKANAESEIGLGGQEHEFAIGRPAYSPEEILRAIQSGTPPEYQETLFQVGMRSRRDYSAIVNRLRGQIRGWEILTNEAKHSLIVAEEQFAMRVGVDYSPATTSFAKAVEITLRANVFAPFQARFSSTVDAPRHLQKAKASKDWSTVKSFYEFACKGFHIELGGMAFALRHLGRPVTTRMELLGIFRQHVMDLGKQHLLSAQVLDKLQLLANERNPSSHARTDPLATAEKVQGLTIELLNVIYP